MPFDDLLERKLPVAHTKVPRRRIPLRDAEHERGVNAGRARGLDSRCAATIQSEKVEWLWHARIARGKHTCIAGEPGTGKSQLSIAIIAAVTTGDQWPCGEGVAPIGNAIILGAEDSAADTIVPRLKAAGADLGRVHVVSTVVNLQRDLGLLEKKIN